MTPEELKKQMQQLVDGTHPRQRQVGYGAWQDDPEVGHGMADDLMVAILRKLGYQEAMKIYAAQTKWYA